MSRIVPQIVTLSQHLQTLKFEPFRYRPLCCPFCGLAGKLHSYGVYFRKANRQREPDVPSFVPIPRFLCASCKRSCSRLPECLPPRRWYPWVIQQTLLTALLMGDSIQKVAHLVDVARQTGRRWWAWLKVSNESWPELDGGEDRNAQGVFGRRPIDLLIKPGLDAIQDGFALFLSASIPIAVLRLPIGFLDGEDCGDNSSAFLRA